MCGPELIGRNQQAFHWHGLEFLASRFPSYASQNGCCCDWSNASIAIRFVAPAQRKEVPLTEQELSNFVGQYNLFNRSATVALRDGRLTLEIPGDPYYWLFAASKVRFFLHNDETEIEFQKDALGKVVEMTIHNSDGSVIRCSRLSVDAPK